MAKECLENCPVIRRIEENIKENKELDVLTEFFKNGLDSTLRASDDCQGPMEKEVDRRDGRRTITPAEPGKVCGLG